MSNITIALEDNKGHPVLRSMNIPNVGLVEVRGTERLQDDISTMSDNDFVDFIVRTLRAKARSLAQ
ncbi:MAG: hypothetical protein ABIG34_00485 [Candidatus Peregrinibacteria bacterium]